MPAPLERCQATVALPAASSAIWGANALRVPSDRSSGGAQAPPLGRVADWTTYSSSAFLRIQTAAARPSGSTATRALEASCPTSDRSTGELHTPPSDRVDDWMIVLVPLLRSQTTVTAPDGVVASAGRNASCEVSDRSTAGVQPPPAGRVDAWTTYFVPLGRYQTAVALPAGSTTTSGAKALCAASERGNGADHAPPAGRDAVCTE